MYIYHEEHTCIKKSFSYGDDSLTASLYQHHATKIAAYLRLHTITTEEADNLLHAVFLAASEQEEDLVLRTKDEQRTWLWKVARNKATQYYRKHGHQIVSIEHVTEIIYED